MSGKNMEHISREKYESDSQKVQSQPGGEKKKKKIKIF
jgi:hypothetical protein